ncbi:MAG: phosphoribosylaminoimidazole carboxylase [Thiotrichales bacterium]
MTQETGQLYRDCGRADAEHFDTLYSQPGVRIERILSWGQASPPGFWYDQPHAEWVALLQGAARLRFADEADARPLVPGNFVLIAAHRRHRVDWTDPHQTTIWLAVHLDPSGGGVTA